MQQEALTLAEEAQASRMGCAPCRSGNRCATQPPCLGWRTSPLPTLSHSPPHMFAEYASKRARKTGTKGWGKLLPHASKRDTQQELCKRSCSSTCSFMVCLRVTVSGLWPQHSATTMWPSS